MILICFCVCYFRICFFFFFFKQKTAYEMRISDWSSDVCSSDLNATWIFTQSQYDIVRSHFDAKYRARIERAAKRENATPRKSRPKRDATTPVVVDDTRLTTT